MLEKFFIGRRILITVHSHRRALIKTAILSNNQYKVNIQNPIQVAETFDKNFHLGFTCSDCGATFNQLSYYSRHRQRAKAGNYVCSDCEKRFCTKTQLKRHVCSYVKPEHQGHSHYKLQTAENFDTNLPLGLTCFDCWTTFGNLDSLKEHKAKAKANNHVCPHCEKRFCTITRLRRHKCSFFNEDNKLLVNNEDNNGDNNKDNELIVNNHVCSACGLVSTSENYLKTHQKRAENLNLSCGECKLRFCTTKQYKGHMKAYHGITANIKTKFVCPDCGSNFSNKADLQRHIKKAQKKNYNCDICDVKFCTQNLRDQHRTSFHDSRIHSQMKQCPECDYISVGYSRRFNMKRHILRMHSNMCPKCYEKFENKTEFDSHLTNSACSPKTEDESNVASIVELSEQIKRMMK